ncbi:MAG: ATP-binding cassette domain-containing protein [bacterium]
MSGRRRPAAVTAQGWGWRHAGRRAWAVAGLDLAIEAGERVLLLGASGSGKSTLLAGLAGLLHGQDSGEAAGRLTIDGVAPSEARDRTGLLLQDPEAQLVMARAGDDVAFGPENHGVARPEIWRRVEEALAVVGFPYPRDRATAALSGGEKQRLALAGVLASRPGLLLLDEPTANLDPAAAAQVRAAVGDALAASGATLVLVEHRVAEWLPLIDRVVVLGEGTAVLADGPPGRVFAAAAAGSLRAAGVWPPDRIPVRRTARAPAGGRERLVARGLSATYRGAPVPAVRSAGLTLPAGTATAVVGPSGSGKSTLALMAAGLLRPGAGWVVATDQPDRPLHRRRPSSLARAVGTVFQNPEHQFITPTVRRELLLAPRRLGWPTERAQGRADELLDRLGLTTLAEANPFTLSGGQKRRLSVATALSVAAPVLVLDEPTFGQDARTWDELADLLAGVRDEGGALLIVSHDEAFVAAVADRTFVMTAGRLTSLQPEPEPSAAVVR